MQKTALPTRDNQAPKQMINGVIRVAGLGILLFGLSIGLKVVEAGWELFDNQSRVLKIASELETHSGINGITQALLVQYLTVQKSPIQQPLPPEAQQLNFVPSGAIPQEPNTSAPLASSTTTKELAAAISKLNVSYLIAWYIVFLLILVISRVSLWAVSEGGKLAVNKNSELLETKNLLRELADLMQRRMISLAPSEQSK